MRICDTDNSYDNYTSNVNITCAFELSQDQEELCCQLTKSLDNEGRIIVCITGIFMCPHPFFIVTYLGIHLLFLHLKSPFSSQAGQFSESSSDPSLQSSFPSQNNHSGMQR